MPRPRRFRRVSLIPEVNYFKPAGVRVVDLEESTLTVEEFEAVRLKDLEGLDQAEAAKKMNISQPTFHRLVLSARKKIADAIVNGKAIKIEGGTYKMATPRSPGRGLRRGLGIGQGGRGLGGGFGLGPSGECVCPKCGNKVPHGRGDQCYKKKCPKCGTLMTRG